MHLIFKFVMIVELAISIFLSWSGLNNTWFFQVTNRTQSLPLSYEHSNGFRYFTFPGPLTNKGFVFTGPVSKGSGLNTRKKPASCLSLFLPSGRPLAMYLHSVSAFSLGSLRPCPCASLNMNTGYGVCFLILRCHEGLRIFPNLFIE